MKDFFELRVVGDSDVLVNDEVFEADTFFFRSFNTKKMIEVLDVFHVEPLSSKTPDKQDATNFRAAIRNMIRFLEYADEKTFTHQEFGNNQYVRVEIIEVPTEEDFMD